MIRELAFSIFRLIQRLHVQTTYTFSRGRAFWKRRTSRWGGGNVYWTWILQVWRFMFCLYLLIFILAPQALLSKNECGVQVFDLITSRSSHPPRFVSTEFVVNVLIDFWIHFRLKRARVGVDCHIMYTIGDFPHACLISTGTNSGDFRVFESFLVIEKTSGRAESVLAFDISPNEQMIACANNDMTVEIFDLRKLSTACHTITSRMANTRGLHFSSDGSMLVLSESGWFSYFTHSRKSWFCPYFGREE